MSSYGVYCQLPSSVCCSCSGNSGEIIQRIIKHPISHKLKERAAYTHYHDDDNDMMSKQEYVQACLPSLDHLTLDDYHHIYEPAEDTYLLCDALEQDRQLILHTLFPQIVLEIGSGSGCAICFLTLLCNSNDCSDMTVKSYATDINPYAVDATRRTAAANGIEINILQSFFADAYQSEVERKVDVLLFNPPYVPTPSEEINGNGIEVSWAGGIDGREVIDKFLPQIPQLLSEKGCCYLVLVEENKPLEIASILSGFNLNCKIVCRRRARNEGLMIMRISFQDY